jgi:dihydropteroate synthase
MGIVNVTPDSFSDGGQFTGSREAIDHALRLYDEGADILDIGGESTRPGSIPVSVQTERQRVIPVIKGIRKHRNAVISVDTYKSETAESALEAGACIINDISALRADRRMAEIIARYRASVVLMHMKGEPETMQEDPHYDDVVDEVYTFLKDRITFAKQAGISQIIIDPGIGFGKRLIDNLELQRSIRHFTSLGKPVLIGVSRKSFIGAILDLPVDQRLEGSLAAAVVGVLHGVSIVRVHDVGATRRAIRVTEAIKRGTGYTQPLSG